MRAAAALNIPMDLRSLDQFGSLISKPLGSAGDGYCLTEEMGLADNKLTYNAIVVCSSGKMALLYSEQYQVRYYYSAYSTT